MSDVSIVVAETSRLAIIRDGLQLPGRMMHFTTGSLGSAVESIRAYRPKIVAIDSAFAQTPQGTSFLERIEAMSFAASAIRLIIEQDGKWSAVTRKQAASAIIVPSSSAGQPNAGAPASAVAAASSNARAIAAQIAVANTRRAPRFLVRDPVEAVVESGHATVIDMSMHGAQMVSLPTLRPNQKIKIGLPDKDDDVLNLVAQVAWSMFEQSQNRPEPYYRVGIEFTDAAQQALEAYRRRHCAEQPIPVRTR